MSQRTAAPLPWRRLAHYPLWAVVVAAVGWAVVVTIALPGALALAQQGVTNHMPCVHDGGMCLRDVEYEPVFLTPRLWIVLALLALGPPAFFYALWRRARVGGGGHREAHT
jgi:hypothetical protein